MALSSVTALETALAANLNQIIQHLQGQAGSTDAYHLRVSNGNDFIVTLSDAAGARSFIIKDSGGSTVASIDSDGNITVVGISLTNLDIPTASSPAQTVEGRAVWDSDDDVLTVGDGASRKTFGYLGTASPAALGTVAAGSSNEAARIDHIHPLNAVIKYKTATQAFTTNTTLADITATSGNLAFAIGASETWRARFIIPVTWGASTHTGGVKVGFTGPASPTYVIANVENYRNTPGLDQANGRETISAATSFPTSLAARNSNNGAGVADVYNAAVQTIITIDLLVVNGANAGTVTLQGAQNSSNGTTNFIAGAFMVAERVE